jgi:hypothetical protein
MEKNKFNYTKAIKQLGIGYLGSYSKSAKMVYSENAGTLTYCLYLAPANMSGYEVCPCSEFCRKFCLNGSGRNKGDIIEKGPEGSRINNSRIKKTKLFFENKDLFMQLMIAEINRSRNYARKRGLNFAVRINGTSDISPEDFIYNGKNILEIYPDIQFYDYTKVYSRIGLLDKYPNYDLTYSYNGHNWGCCENFLERGGKVAVVFENQDMLPMKFKGYNVWDANGYDMRFMDPKGWIMGLHYHKTAANYDKNGNYIRPNNDFVISDENEDVEWFAE